MNISDLELAVNSWRSVLDNGAVLPRELAEQHYGPNTCGLTKQILAALRPRNADQIVALVKVANTHKIPIYPVSRGKNWGHGCAIPVTDGCVIVDLSNMNRILEMDEQLGLVTLEPGVTPRQLRDYLDARHLDYLVPVSGAGPNVSLIGNALERGFGITPHTDHFGCVTALEAVLPNGEIYRSALSEMGGQAVDKTFKWGIGPYLDGLFTQSNLGIVTQVTIALAPKPEQTQAFCFKVKENVPIGTAAEAVRETLKTVGGNTGGINLINARRVLAMMEPYPAARVPKGSVIPREVIWEMARRNQIAPWFGIGAIYGTRKVVRATRSAIKQTLAPYTNLLLFFDEPLIRLGKRLLTLLPIPGRTHLFNTVNALGGALENMSGIPSEIALKLCYWKSGTKPLEGSELNPTHDGCGLMWYTPLVPMKAEALEKLVPMVEETCIEHGIEPLITFTSVLDRCFICTIPLLFDRANKEETMRAQKCYEALFSKGKAEGFVPYRVGIYTMPHVADVPCAFWDLVGKIKSAIDPNGIIAPKRYSK